MSANTPSPHRQSSRKLADRILGIQIEPDNYAIVLNVSDGGIGFRTISPLTQSGTIRFSFLENGRTVAASAELAWTDEARMTGGLSFASLPQPSRERFRKWIGGGDVSPQTPWPAAKSEAPPAEESAFAGSTPPPAPVPEVAQPSSFGGHPAAPYVSQREPAHAGFALFEDLPRGPGYAAAWDQEVAIPQERSRFFAGFVTGVVFTALVGTIVFFMYGNSIRALRTEFGSVIGASPVQGPAPAAPPVMPPPAAMPTDPTPSAAPSAVPSVDSAEAPPPSAPLSTVNEEPSATPLAAASAPLPPATKENISNTAAKTSAPAAEPGAEDFAIAERYLNEHPGHSGSATAAGYLWAAVKKGSVDAEITLAELYIRGEGVPKNCGQARVLLSAAAKKGNKMASEELAQLVRKGCR